MRQKMGLVWFLTGLFLLHAVGIHASNAIGMLVDDGRFINVFCKKANPISNSDDFKFTDNTVGQSAEIHAVCITAPDFEATEFSFFKSTNNYKDYGFNNSLHLNIVLDRHLLPPQK